MSPRGIAAKPTAPSPFMTRVAVDGGARSARADTPVSTVRGDSVEEDYGAEVAYRSSNAIEED